MRLQVYFEIVRRLSPVGGIRVVDLIRDIAHNLNISERSVYYALKKLEEEGLIFRKYCYGRAHKCVYPSRKLRAFYNDIIASIMR